MNAKRNSGRQTPKVAMLSLRAQGKAPRANYVIIPAAGSLFGNATFLRDDPERAQSVVDRMLANSGVPRSKKSNKCLI
jgi:hypothetical protein